MNLANTAAAHERLKGLRTWDTSLTAAAAEASLLNHELPTLEYGVLDRGHRREANTVTELARAFPVDASLSRIVESSMKG